MIYMTRIDPAQNMARFYVMCVQPTLFGDWSLMKEWGRIGGAGQQRIRAFAKRCDADAALAQELKRRVRRGYVVK